MEPERRALSRDYIDAIIPILYFLIGMTCGVALGILLAFLW